MDDMSFLLLIKSLSDSEGYCKITDLINNSNCPEMEVWSHIRELDKRKLICAFLEEVQLLPDAFSYLSKAKQERKERKKKQKQKPFTLLRKSSSGLLELLQLCLPRF